MYILLNSVILSSRSLHIFVKRFFSTIERSCPIKTIRSLQLLIAGVFRPLTFQDFNNSDFIRKWCRACAWLTRAPNELARFKILHFTIVGALSEARIIAHIVSLKSQEREKKQNDRIFRNAHAYAYYTIMAGACARAQTNHKTPTINYNRNYLTAPSSFPLLLSMRTRSSRRASCFRDSYLCRYLLLIKTTRGWHGAINNRPWLIHFCCLFCNQVCGRKKLDK